MPPCARSRFLSVALFTAVTAVAQAPAKPHPESGAAYLPLQAGSSWTWQVTAKADGTGPPVEEVAWDFGEVPLDSDGPVQRTCHQLLTTRSDHAGVAPQYWSADETGIYEHDRRYLADLRGPGRDRTRLLPTPVGIETRWTWTYQLAYQTDGDVQRDAERDRVTCVGMLVAPAEQVATPAGTFTAAHVRIISTCAHWQGVSVRELWFARGTGLVMELQRSAGGGEVVRKLAAHTAAPVRPTDAEGAVRAVLQADPRAQETMRIEWLPLDEAACYLRGRVALVTFASTHGEAARTAYWCEDREAVEIGAGDVAFWSQRFTDVRRAPAVRARPPAPRAQHRPDDGPALALQFGGMEFTMLAAVFGGIEAHRQGLTDLVSIGSNTKTDMNNGESTHTALWHCRDAEGAGRDLEASFAVSSGKLTAATTKTGESTREAPARKTPTPGVPTPRGR